MEEFNDLEINGFIKNHNFKLISYDNEECIIEAPIDENSLNPYDIVHGGLIFGLMDTCSGVHIYLETKRKVVTTSSNINFLKPGTGEKLIAKSKTIRIGNSLSVIEVNLYNDKNDLISTGVFNYYFID